MVVVVDVERRKGELYFGVWNVWRGVVSTSAERVLKFSCQTSGPCPNRFCGGVLAGAGAANPRCCCRMRSCLDSQLIASGSLR
jgi:hypothetical protein